MTKYELNLNQLPQILQNCTDLVIDTQKETFLHALLGCVSATFPNVSIPILQSNGCEQNTLRPNLAIYLIGQTNTLDLAKRIIAPIHESLRYDVTNKRIGKAGLFIDCARTAKQITHHLDRKGLGLLMSNAFVLNRTLAESANYANILHCAAWNSNAVYLENTYLSVLINGNHSDIQPFFEEYHTAALSPLFTYCEAMEGAIIEAITIECETKAAYEHIFGVDTWQVRNFVFAQTELYKKWRFLSALSQIEIMLNRSQQKTLEYLYHYYLNLPMKTTMKFRVDVIGCFERTVQRLSALFALLRSDDNKTFGVTDIDFHNAIAIATKSLELSLKCYSSFKPN